ncbi:MAG TPA: PhzF family phenazine biosynthesis protein [Candidatus Limnocylindrales bacterium]|jgi:predicted PhzF superfamily epimerase YddE/YHI9
MTTLHVVRVFIGPDGRGGNPLGVFLDGGVVPDDRRQAVAARLGFSETVFVDDRRTGRIRIFTPAAELPFAGHPTVGTAWLLRRKGSPVDALHPPAGEVRVRHDDERTWIRADPAWIHRHERVRLASPAEVEDYEPPRMGEPGVYVWAWLDEAAGDVRARYFATDYGIAEDEATGAAAVAMGGDLRRDLTIHQGVASEIVVRPQADGMIEIGGRVEPVETREDAGA